ncbi:MAG TPA: hypothetical protein P5279_13530 [Anaerohalosphaeraceae bacterium]|jgi:transcriptional regulator with XRE-family HTH domain|nr:hypothetical protein [Anaerohalosphaeraceae bacterium]HRT51509.1 hypothetical protein [Anaerohalosphaeraceae bacterium]HRT87156.1 hypothetical protein [Anaerohalosphaeraceae bacterium]
MVVEFNNGRDWLDRMIKQEDYSCVSAGGVYARVSDMEKEETGADLDVFGRLVELARRRAGMSLPDLAAVAQVNLKDLAGIEKGGVAGVEPRVVFTLAKALKLPVQGMMELAGLMKRRGRSLGEAAMRFAAKASHAEKLTANEREALEEFVKVLAECSDGERPK